MSDPQNYTVGWICALPIEFDAAQAFLDDEHEGSLSVAQRDNNSYALGRIGRHNVVIAVLPDGEGVRHQFGGGSSLRHAARLPQRDVVVSSRDGANGGVFQYDYGKAVQNQDAPFQHTGFFRSTSNGTPDGQRVLEKWPRLRLEYSHHPPKAIGSTNPKLSIQIHQKDAESCVAAIQTILCPVPNEVNARMTPMVHYGLIASANQLVKDVRIRDKLAAENSVLCFEMEAAGLMNHFPCLVIRGICDYSDSHKSKEWQGFAAMMVAAYGKDLLGHIPPNKVEAERPVGEVIGSIQEGVKQLYQTIDETKTAITHHTCVELSALNLRLQTAEDLSVARSPHHIIPFTSDPDFVQRADIWTWIIEQYAGPARRMGLLAIHFAHKIHVESPDISIFWVSSNTKETFEESYRSLADVLALPRRHDPEVHVLVLVLDWLQRDGVSQWLMIVDSADDVGVFSLKDNNDDRTHGSLASYFAKTANGKILVTSRSMDAAERLTGSSKTILQIPAMDEEQALQLLRRKLENKVDEDAAVDLIHSLDRIPLAVNQAAAYINRRSPRVTIRSYLGEFRKSEKRRNSLLRSDKGDLRRHSDVSNSVVVTWQVTFEQIRRDRPSAANLLSLMSYFQVQNIPESIVQGYNDDISADHQNDHSNSAGETGSHGSSGKDGFEDDMDVLRGYSLVTLTTMGLCDMHSLVQFCTRMWILEFGDPKRWNQLFIRLAAAYFPLGAFDTMEGCQTLLPHVRPILGQVLEDEDNRVEIKMRDLSVRPSCSRILSDRAAATTTAPLVAACRDG
ncbi:unnamed protein product [Clonostachys rhizophaga]|uniref:Uncharacterized protein n=1 Tax=Clonostachys rhizophaga TaxID=160324 RepID=A0A9N9YGT2_9HYPO|nr:unnamed protein product [Clonostachys rhizophaga]